MANYHKSTMAIPSIGKAKFAEGSAMHINVRAEKDISVSLDFCSQGQNDIDDITSSLGTMSNSDSKSRHTTFSAPLQCRSITCSSPTTPSQSRAGSPVRPQWTAMEADLRGIGDPATFKASLPFHSPNLHQSQAFPANLMIDTASVIPLPGSSSMGTFQSGKTGTEISNEDGNSSTPRRQSPQAFSGDSPTSDILTIYEVPSSSENSEEEDDGLDLDLDLEKTADSALARWFGISLSRLTRPIRVLYAFEGVKEQCAGILQDEGHYLHGDQDDQFVELCDMQNSSESCHEKQSCGGPLPSNEASGSNARKRSNSGNSSDDHDMNESGSSPQYRITTRGANKRRRARGEYSCPYRKRNPLRFNVRDHEECAVRSFEDMAKLKRHLSARHYIKPSCTRCHANFENTEALLLHYERCAVPPQPATITIQTDPEDGFGERVEKKLKSRKNRDKVDNWNTLYQLLFGDDEKVPPSDYEPVYEHHEVAHQYKGLESVIDKEISDLLARRLPGQDTNCAHLLAEISDLYRRKVCSLLKYAPWDSPEFGMSHQSQPLGCDFVNVVNDASEEQVDFLEVDQPCSVLNTSQYLSTEREDAVFVEKSVSRVDSLEDLHLPTTLTFGQAQDAVQQNPRMVEDANYHLQETELEQFLAWSDPNSFQGFAYHP